MTERDDLREAFSKIVIESDRDWNGNVSQYRKYLVDRLTDSGLFGLAATPAPGYDQEAVAWMVKNDFGHWYTTMDRALAATWRDTERLEVQPLYTAPPSSRMREALINTLASLAASISLLERMPKAKKAAPYDKMFDQMLVDYKSALEAGREALRAGDNHASADQTYRVEYDGFVGTKQGEYVTREGKSGVVLQQVGTKVVHVYNEARIVPVDYASDGKKSEGGADGRAQCLTTARQDGPGLRSCRASVEAGIKPGPSDPTPADREAIALALAEKWPGDFMQGDDEIEREPSAFAYEVADVAILALRGGE